MWTALLGALKSKTIWASLILALVGALSDAAQQAVAANPGTALSGIAALFAALRVWTTSALSDK